MKVSRQLIPGQGALGVAELCAFLGIHRNTLRKIRLSSTPPFPQPTTLTDNGRQVWLTSEVEAWLRARRELRRNDRVRVYRFERKGVRA